MPLTRLLHLASPALPVGAFSYSQGLEWAVECGEVNSAEAATHWIRQMLHDGLAQCEARALLALLQAWRANDLAQVATLNMRFIATRETAELRAETLQMGYSLTRLLRDLPEIAENTRTELARFEEICFPCAWAAAAANWQLAEAESLTAYLWAWLENQVMAAVKLVPLGQTAGQQLLLTLSGEIDSCVTHILATQDAPWQNFTPLATLASMQHETQYTRLFRS